MQPLTADSHPALYRAWQSANFAGCTAQIEQNGPILTVHLECGPAWKDSLPFAPDDCPVEFWARALHLWETWYDGFEHAGGSSRITIGGGASFD